LCSGNTRRANRELAERDVDIPESTLRTWKERTQKQAYQQLVEEELPQVYAAIAERCEDLALAQADVEAKLLAKLEGDLDKLDARDLASSLRNVNVAKAVNIDKASLVRGKPTEIREDRSLTEVARALSKYASVVKVNGQVVDSTAVELPALAGSDDSRATQVRQQRAPAPASSSGQDK
jgi:hypothetical protein